MKKRQPARKALGKKAQGTDGSFVLVAEMSPDHWRDLLENFFDEKEAGQDHVRRLMDLSKADIDHYDFTGGYDLSPIAPAKPEFGHGPKASRMPAAYLRDSTPVYEGTGCFRYAIPG